MKDRVNLAYLVEFAASLAIRQMDFERAARLFGAAEQIFNLLENTLIPLLQKRRQQDLADLQAELGSDLFNQYFLEGVELSHSQIYELLKPDVRIS
jgi:hypothetical protein